MTVYRDNLAPTVISDGKVIVNFKGDIAEVSESTAKILERIGYRVEKPDEKGEGDNGTTGDPETVPPDGNGDGGADTSRNGKKRN